MADQPDRKVVKAALRNAGLSDREVRALLLRGWRGLVSERDAELAEVLEQLEVLRDNSSAHRSSASDGA